MGFFNNKIFFIFNTSELFHGYLYFFCDKDKWAIYFAMLALRQDFGLNAQMCKII
jgi:hypothetical protein